MPSEATFKRAVRAKLAPSVYVWPISARWQKGVPDWWVSGSEKDLWIEFKYQKTIPQKTLKLNLSKLQQDWLLKRKNQGRTVAVIVGVAKQAYLLTTTTTIQNNQTPTLNLELCTIQQIADWISYTVGIPPTKT